MQTIKLTLELDTSAAEAGLHRIIQQLEKIEMKQSELAIQLTETTAKIEKIGAETRALLAKVDDLQAAVDVAGDVNPDVLSALSALQSQAATVDAPVPDAPTSDFAPPASDSLPPVSDSTPPVSDSTPPPVSDTGSVGVQP